MAVSVIGGFIFIFAVGLANAIIKIKGDLTIVGLFRIYETKLGLCGTNVKIASVMNAEAVKWYLQQVNQTGLLPFYIGFEAYETCRLETKAAEVAVHLLNRVLNNETIGGIVGPEFSSEAEVISSILSSVVKDRQLVQVGFSTTAAVLADRDKYPNFVRVVPNDTIQVETMIATMLKLQWNRIAVLYEDDIYGQDAINRLQKRATEEEICISVVRKITVQNGIDVNQINAIMSEIVQVSNSRLPISGFVLFGASVTVKTIFQWLDNSGVLPTPAVMLSDGFNMDKTVFQNHANDKVISRAKGTLAFTPPVNEVKSFTTHWRGIFSNASKFKEENSTNPWLTEVYYAVTNCYTKDCQFVPLSEVELNRVFVDQPLYLSYAVTAVHMLIKALNNTYEKLCHGARNCSAFWEQFKPGDIIDEIKGMDADLAKEVIWLPSFKMKNSLPTTINENGEIKLEANRSIYELYKYQATDLNQQIFYLIKVGDYKDKTVEIDFSNFRDYSDTGQTLLWPNIRKAQCPAGTKCSECIEMSSLQNGFIFEPGDVYVIGVVPVFNSDGVQGCSGIRITSGYQAAESIHFAMKKINNKTEFPDLFPGLKIGLIVLNSCNNPVVIQHKIYQLHFNGLLFSNGTILQVKDKIIGYIGEVTSDLSIAVAEQLTRLKIVQVSYASATATLSDRTRFPYFMRVPSAVPTQATAIIEIVKQLEGTYIQIIHSASEYGTQGRDHVTEIAKQNGICVIQAIAFADQDNVNSVYEQIRRYPHAMIVIVILQSNIVEPVMSNLVTKLTKGEFIFIGSQTWDKKTKMFDVDWRQTLEGSYSISFDISQDVELLEHIQQLTPESFKNDPWSLLYLQERKNCYYDLSFDKSKSKPCPRTDAYNASLDYLDTIAYIATKSLVIGASNFFKSKCGSNTKLCDDFRNNPSDLVKSIQTVTMNMSGRTSRVFNNNSDGTVGYKIYNIHKDAQNLSKLAYVEIGKYPLHDDFVFAKEKIVYPTDGKIISQCPNTKACESCLPSPTTPSSIQPKSLDLDPARLGLGIVVGILLLLLIVLVTVIIYMYRKMKMPDDTYINPVDNGGYLYANSLGRREPEGVEPDINITDVPIPPCIGSPPKDNYNRINTQSQTHI